MNQKMNEGVGSNWLKKRQVVAKNEEAGEIGRAHV